MTKILFTNGNGASGALGTVTRMVSIADEIYKIEPDAELFFRAAGEEKQHLSKLGYTVVDGYGPNLFGAPAFFAKLMDLGPKNRPIPPIPDIEFVIRLKGMLNKPYLERTFREELALVERIKPDCIYGGFDLVMPIVARKLGIRYIPVGQSVMSPVFRSELFPKHESRDYSDLYNRALRKIGLPGVCHIRELFFEYYSSQIIVPAIPELEELADVPNVEYTGSLLPERFSNEPFYWNKVRPLIYVYLGVGQISPDRYIRELTNAFGRSDYDVILAIGDHPYVKKQNTYSIGNVHFYRIVPSEELMKHCDLVIHHGGQNTMVQSIMEQVPAIIFPGLHFERYFNAKKAEEIGCAVVKKNEEFTSKILLTTVTDLLKNQDMHNNLAHYSTRIKQYGGKRKAAFVLLNRNENPEMLGNCRPLKN
jgi:UDP:flavonoid glycosyltransferase YjiC (YdhE family)